MGRVVIDLADARPIWRMPPSAVDAVRRAFPPEWDCIAIEQPTSGSGDGAGPSAAALDAVGSADVYLGYGVSPALLRAAGRLRWAHSAAAGVRGSLTRELLSSDVVLTNSAGIHAEPIAETVIGMILHFARGMDWAVRAQAERRWWKAPYEAADSPVREVAGSTVGIVGFGGIGRAVAARARALGACVLAVRRRPGEADGVELVHGPMGLAHVLSRADYLVLAVPETPDTVGLLDRAALGRLKPGAVVINVARGGIIDETALVDALSAGRLRGAGLDVFATEPLLAEHPLWRLENVLITPHVAATSHRFWDRETALIVENARRFRAGEPLLNVVDKAAGY